MATARTPIARLQVATVLQQFIDNQVLPGTGISPAAFWKGFDAIVADLAPKEQIGTYMGFAFLPVAIGTFVAPAAAHAATKPTLTAAGSPQGSRREQTKTPRQPAGSRNASRHEQTKSHAHEPPQQNQRANRPARARPTRRSAARRPCPGHQAAPTRLRPSSA